MTIDPRLHRIVAAQPYPFLFATISGAHLYGFPSPDSDFDLRGAHVLPLEKVVGLQVERPPIRRVKPLLYIYRVLLTGIHLMRTGEIEANLLKLNDEFHLSQISDLVARKQTGENISIEDADLAFHQREYERLRTELQAAHDASQLPELPSDETRAALNDLLIRVRLTGRFQ
jgi:predicted nucleotidyltransferase